MIDNTIRKTSAKCYFISFIRSVTYALSLKSKGKFSQPLLVLYNALSNLDRKTLPELFIPRTSYHHFRIKLEIVYYLRMISF